MAHSFFKIFIYSILATESYFKYANSARAVIWSCRHNDFVAIENIPEFYVVQQDTVKNSREVDTDNFQNATFRIAVVVKKDRLEIRDNRTISGYHGEVWNVLAQHFNFTIVPIQASHDGRPMPDGGYDGAIGMVLRNEVDILIPHVYAGSANVVQHTIPTGQAKYHLYTKTISRTPGTVRTFPPIIWCFILLMFVLMSVISYVAQKTLSRVHGNRNVSLKYRDHLFYTFAFLCCQGFIPNSIYRHTKIISFTKAIFGFLILTALSSRLVSITSNSKMGAAFEDLSTMFKTSNYSLIIDTDVAMFPQVEGYLAEFLADERFKNRIIDIQSMPAKYEKLCQEKGDYALLNLDSLHHTYGDGKCNVAASRKVYTSVAVGAALSEKFKHRATINTGLLKMWESGLLNRLRKQWLHPEPTDDKLAELEPVSLEQVAVPFAVLGIGMVLSIIIFIIEHIVYIYNRNRC